MPSSKKRSARKRGRVTSKDTSSSTDPSDESESKLSYTVITPTLARGTTSQPGLKHGNTVERKTPVSRTLNPTNMVPGSREARAHAMTLELSQRVSQLELQMSSLQRTILEFISDMDIISNDSEDSCSPSESEGSLRSPSSGVLREQVSPGVRKLWQKRGKTPQTFTDGTEGDGGADTTDKRMSSLMTTEEKEVQATMQLACQMSSEC